MIRNTKTKPSIPNTRAAAPGTDSAGAETDVVVPPVPPTLMSTLAVLLVLKPSLTLNSMLAMPENPALGVKTTSIVEYPSESATFDSLGANTVVPPTVLTITQFRLSSVERFRRESSLVSQVDRSARKTYPGITTYP